MRILITGAAGYVGSMLADQFSHGPYVEEIVCIDRATMPALLREKKKITWYEADLANGAWSSKLENKPDVVIHTAWQRHDAYLRTRAQRANNLGAAYNVFNYCMRQEIKKLIHLSAVHGYGAFATNSVERPFIENDPFRETEYRFGLEKSLAEQVLKKMCVGSKTQVFIMRPATITGPYGGTLGRPLFPELANRFLGKEWRGHFVHEDDLVDAVGLVTFSKIKEHYEVFNIAPRAMLSAHEVALYSGNADRALAPLVTHTLFDLMWDFSFGMSQTSPGSWRFTSYPLPVDGSKITRMYNFSYEYSARQALEAKEGRYASNRK